MFDSIFGMILVCVIVLIVFSLLVSIPLGMLAGYFENSWFDRITNGLHYVAISIPSFWFAIMLIILFSLNLGWLPSSGMRTTGVHTFWDLSRHAIMPVLVLSIAAIAVSLFAGLAYYVIWGAAVLLFVLAVWYTVKML